MLSTVRLTWCMIDTAEGAGKEREREASVRRWSGYDPYPFAGCRQACYCHLELLNFLPAVAGLSKGQQILNSAV